MSDRKFAVIVAIVSLTLISTISCSVIAQRECMAEGHSFVYCWRLLNR